MNAGASRNVPRCAHRFPTTAPVTVFLIHVFLIGPRAPSSSRGDWLTALQEAAIFTEVTSRSLAKEQASPQIEGIAFNWYWVKFCSEYVYVGRGQTHTPIMVVPYFGEWKQAYTDFYNRVMLVCSLRMHAVRLHLV